MENLRRIGGQFFVGASALQILLLNGILFLTVPVSFSQNANLRNVSEVWYSPLLGVENSIESELSEVNNISHHQLIPGYTMILDSVYEEKNFGYYTEFYRWYYSYTESYKLDTIGGYFYNGKGEIQKITESRKYNSAGQLLKLVRRQPDYNALDFYGDSTIIDYHTEEYKYQDGKLVWKKIDSQDFFTFLGITEHFFTYDEYGKLLKDSTLFFDEPGEVYTYFYNANNKLEYEVNKYGGNNRSIQKYIYEETDTTLLTIRKGVYIYSEEASILLDTISHWMIEDTFYEIFDEQGRRAILETRYWDVYSGDRIGYKAVYEYNEINDLLYISYYSWMGTIEEGYWNEAMRRDYTYDDEGNILLFEKTIYDARTEKWIIENKKEYYYTPVSSVLEIKENSFTALEMYPNPAHSMLTLKGTFNPSANYTIVNLTGRIIAKGKLVKGSIDVSTYDPGLYIVMIETDSGVYSGKFVKN